MTLGFKQTLKRTAFKVLLVEDNFADAELIQRLLLEAEEVRVALTHVRRVSEAIEALEPEDFDVILLDLLLSDSKGVDTITRVQEYCYQENHKCCPPIIVLTGRDDEELALKSINAGAQDYLIKGKLESELLFRSLRYAIESQLARESLRQIEEKYCSVVDNVKEVIFQTDASGNWTFLNPAWTEITGFPVAQSLGTPFLNYIHPDDRQGNLETFRSLVEGKKDYCRHEIRYLTKSGRFRWIEERVRLTFACDGTISGTTGTLTDITEQKLAQDALRLSESRLRGYFENSLVGIVINTPDKGLVEVNDAFCNLVGYSRVELTKKNWIEWTHPDDLNAELEQLILVFSGESDGYVLDKRFICKNGQVIYTRSSVRCIRREDGACDHLVAVVLDLNDRYRYEQQLKASEALLNHTINAITDPIFVKDEHHNWLILNDACCQWIGKSREELIGKSDYGFLPEAEADAFWEKDELVFASGCENENEEEFTDSEGNLHIISTKKTVFENTDGSKILVGTFRDVTNYKRLLEALQQSEARFQKLAANVPGMIFEFVGHTDGSFSYPYASSACREICEVEPCELMEKAVLAHEQVYLRDRDRFYESIATSARTLQPFSWEGRLVGRTSGKLKWIQCAARPEKLANGDILWHGVAMDISDRKQAEAALQQQLLREQLVGAMQERIRRTLNLEEVLKTAVEEVRQFLHTDRTIIYRFYPNWSGVIEVESVGKGWMSILGFVVQDECFAETYVPLYQQGRIRAIEDIHKAGLQQCHRDLLTGFEVKANLVVPLLQGENLWGLLVAHHCRDVRAWQSFEIECLRQLSVQLAIAIQQSTLYQQAQTEITERKQALAALRKSEAREREKAQELENALQELKNTQTQLVQSEKMASLGQLVAGVAHEINNPTSFIYGNVSPAIEYASELLDLISLYQQHYPTPVAEIQDEIEAIELDFIKEDFPKLLRSMQEGASRIQEIVLSLRNFSRLDEAERKKADLHQGLESTVRILYNRLKEQPTRAAIMVIREYGDLPLVECHPGELNQVFMNILSNAIDAIEERLKDDSSVTPQIRICTEVLTLNGQHSTDKVVIRITDNGSGIPPNVQQRLFDPFFTTKPVGRGTGLGLSISHSIVVKKHQGELYYHSQLGRGTEFVIELPLQPESPPHLQE